MQDLEELKKVALSATPHGLHIYDNPRDHNNWKANRDYINYMHSDRVIDLIARCESAEKDRDERNNAANLAIRKSIESEVIANVLRDELKELREQKPVAWAFDRVGCRAPDDCEEYIQIIEADAVNQRELDEYLKHDRARPLYAGPVAQSRDSAEPVGYMDDLGDIIKTSIFKQLRYDPKTTKYSIAVYAHPPQSNANDHSDRLGRNEYGLDMGYMVGKLNLLIRDISRHKPDEAARVLARLAKVADEAVLAEPEFSQQSPAVAAPTEQQILRVAEMVIPAAFLAEENYKICSFAYSLLSAPQASAEQKMDVAFPVECTCSLPAGNWEPCPFHGVRATSLPAQDEGKV